MYDKFYLYFWFFFFTIKSIFFLLQHIFVTDVVSAIGDLCLVNKICAYQMIKQLKSIYLPYFLNIHMKSM